jgi:MscS family membrane protein
MSALTLSSLKHAAALLANQASIPAASPEGWMPAIAYETFAGLAIWQFVAVFGTFVLGLLARALVTYMVREKLHKWFAALGRRWLEATSKALDKPLGTLVLGLVFMTALPFFELPENLEQILDIAIGVVVNFGIIWALYRLVDVLALFMAEKADATETKLDDQLVPLIQKSLKVFLILTGGVFVLQNLNVDVGSALAGLGIGGLAFALAAKDTIANLFGSLMIFTDRPFQIGDWVVIGDVEGTVEEVGFRSSRIRTFYNSRITMPNAKVVDTVVDNMGLRHYRRIKQTLGVEYSTSPEQIEAFCDGIRAIIKAHPDSRKDYYLVYFNGFGDFSLNIMVYCFVKVPDWQAELSAKHQMYLEFLRLAKELGIGFAFPTQTLHIETLPTPGTRPQLAPPSDDELKERIAAFAPKGRLSRPAGPQLSGGYLAEPSRAAKGDEGE